MSTARLLRLAAEALDRGEQPFSDEFLTVNKVTFDQCMNLAQMLALGARVVADGIDKPGSPLGQAVLMKMAEGA